MLQPKKSKFRKDTERDASKAMSYTRQVQYRFRVFRSLKSLEPKNIITSRQLEAARVAIMPGFMKREGKQVTGSGYSLISLLPRNLRRYVWVKVRVTLNIGWPFANRAE